MKQILQIRLPFLLMTFVSSIYFQLRLILLLIICKITYYVSRFHISSPVVTIIVITNGIMSPAVVELESESTS